MIVKPPKNPKFFDVLCAALCTLWVIALVGLCIAFAFGRIASFGEFVFLTVGVLFLGGGGAFILSAIVSFPLWLIFKYAFELNRNIAAIIGSLTGLIIGAFVAWLLSLDFSGATIMATKDIVLIVLLFTGLGAFAGWNGYRVAWGESLFKPKAKHDL